MTKGGEGGCMFGRVYCHRDNDRWMNRRFHQFLSHRLALRPASASNFFLKRGKEHNTQRMTSSDAIDDSIQAVC